MIIKKKYPSSQGYGSGRQGNISNQSQMAVERSFSQDKEIQFNAVNQHTGTYDNTNAARSQSNDRASSFPNQPAPPAPAVNYLVYRLENQGGNRDAGNTVDFTDWDGNPVTAFVGNNGAVRAIQILGGTEGDTVITGDPYALSQVSSESDRVAAQAYFDSIITFDFGDGTGITT